MCYSSVHCMCVHVHVHTILCVTVSLSVRERDHLSLSLSLSLSRGGSRIFRMVGVVTLMHTKRAKNFGPRLFNYAHNYFNCLELHRTWP